MKFLTRRNGFREPVNQDWPFASPENAPFQYMLEEHGTAINEGHPLLSVSRDEIEQVDKALSSTVDGWGATLMTCREDAESASKFVKGFSAAVAGRLRAKGYSETTANMADLWMVKRFKDRCIINADSYNSSARDHVPEELVPLMEKARDGTASPAERLLVMQGLGMMNIELGRVSAAFVDARQPLVDEMKAAIDDTVVLFGGEPSTEPKEYQKPNSEEAGDHRVSLIVVKVPLAVLPDGTKIAERRTYVAESLVELENSDLPGVVDEASSTGAVLISITAYAYKKQAS